MLRRARWLTLLACLALPAPASAAVESVPGEVIVRYAPGTSAAERAASRSRAGASFKRALPISQSQLLAVKGSVGDAVDRLNRQRKVRYAEPNYIYRASAPVPNDELFGQLWGLRNTGQFISESGNGVPGIDTRALGAWDVTRGAGAVIATVDTGVDLGHPDLAGNLWANDDPPGGGDNDNNGYVDDLRGRDFVDGDSTPDDENTQEPPACLPGANIYHGTHVSGTIAAVDGNGMGVAGVAPDARIMAVRVLDDCGGGNVGDIAAGIVYAAREGADVVNLSLGGPGGSSTLSDAVHETNARNAVVVAAAGNTGSDNDASPEYPCALPHANLICVASINNDSNRSGFSNYGPTTVDVGAPGHRILSTQGTPSPDYQYLSGTSMAAPHVSGVAALARRSSPAATDTQLVQEIKLSVRTLPSLTGWIATGGIVDAAAAIRRLRPPPRVTPPPRPSAPAKASFRRSKRSIRVSPSGRFRFSFRAGARLKGRITLKTVRRVSPRRRGRKRRASFANKTLTVPGSGRVTVRFKLSRRNRLILRRYQKLRIVVSVKLRNSANLTSTARIRITLRAPRRRR